MVQTFVRQLGYGECTGLFEGCGTASLDAELEASQTPGCQNAYLTRSAAMLAADFDDQPRSEVAKQEA